MKARYEATLDWTRIGAYFLEDEHVSECVERFRAELGDCEADVVVSFGNSANLISVLSCPDADDPKVIVREGN